jgi:hypothetical protein
MGRPKGIKNKKASTNVYITCIQCSKIVEVRKYREFTAKFCSRSCKSRYIYHQFLKYKFNAKGLTSWNKGRKETRPEILKRLSDSHIGKMTGSKSPFWKGGTTDELQKRISSISWKRIRLRIYKRDNWTCQHCHKHCSKKGEIQCHHIIPYKISKDDSDENLITLCRNCHKKEEYKCKKKYYYA